MSTTTRLLNLLSLLQTQRDWPGSLLAARLGISDRTVRRDIDRWRELGYRIDATKGPDGGYRLDAGSQLPPLLFDDDQVVALVLALQTATVTGAGIETDALRTLTTVRQVLPSRLRHRLDALSVTTIPTGTRDQPTASPRILLSISATIRARETLRFDYVGQPRQAQPHHLVTTGGKWYLLAWQPEQEDWRLYRVDRIQPRTPNGPTFTPREVPGGDAGQFVAARFKGSEQTNQWPCLGTAILHLPARDVTPFAGDGLVEELGPDRCHLTLGSWSWVALAAAFNRFDTNIDAPEPPELREAFALLATRNARSSMSFDTRDEGEPTTR
ncbi:MAG: helix-turn-helix transcriptional regulator [Beutenbergiaceae bacterium]